VGELLWSNLRGVIYSIAFLAVMLAFGLVASPLALFVPVAVVFIGFAFGAAGFAITTHMRSWKDFDFIFIILTPLFLFSATFYPVEIYPGALRYIVELSPLTRGTHLVRSLTFGDLNLLMLVDIGFLSLVGFLGYRHAVSRLGKLLLK
jgi:lipooligosaccharide transport system permease protein